VPLLDAETFYLHQCSLGPAACASCAAMAHPVAEWIPRQYWTAHTRPHPFRVDAAGTPEPGPDSFAHHLSQVGHPMGLVLDVPAAVVVVNDGRWVVHCPDPGCDEAQVASRGDRRYFCTTCLNREAGGHWRPVVWPDDQEMEDVERILGQRADVKQRQWWPSDHAGKPIPEFKLLLDESRLRQLQVPSRAMLAAMGQPEGQG